MTEPGALPPQDPAAPLDSDGDRSGQGLASGLPILLAVLWLTGLTWWLAIPSAPGYSFDDREAIVGNPVVMGSLPATEALQRDYWHHRADAGHYRPLATLSLRADAARVDVLSPEAPLAFRRTNLALHLLVVGLLGLALLIGQGRGGPRLPWFGLGLLAVHPSTADATAWISGRTSLLSGLGAAVGLLAILLATDRARRATEGSGSRGPSLSLISIGAFAGALLSLLAKEDGFVIAAAAPLVAAAVAAGRRRAAFLAASAASGAALVAVAWLRFEALGTALPSAPAALLSDAPLASRLALGIGAWWHGVTAAVLPWLDAPPSLTLGDLSESLPLREPLRALIIGRGVPGFGVVGAGLIVLAIATLIRRRQGALLSLALSLLAVLPLVQLVPAGELYAPRFLYQPLLLGVVWTSALAAVLCNKLPKGLGAAAQVAILIALAALSVTRAAPTYDSRASYWQAHLPAHEGEARIWNALGECEREAGRLVEASEHFLESHLLDPRYSRPLANLGALEAKRGNLETAAAYLRQAIAEGPREASPRANLATVLMRQDLPEEALGLYVRAAELEPGRATYHRGTARALIRLDRFDEALEALARAEALAPRAPETIKLRKQLDGRSGQR